MTYGIDTTTVGMDDCPNEAQSKTGTSQKTTYIVPDSTGWARFHIEPNRILDYICEIFYEEKRRFEKCEQKCYSPRAIKHESIKGWET